MGRLSIPFLVAALFIGASAFSYAQDDAASLTQEVAALREDVAALRAELDEANALLDSTLAYLDRRSKSAAQMAGVLSASEEAGFTFGINPRSRQLLLEGWRKELSDRQKDLPGKPAPVVETSRDVPRR